LSCNRPNLFGLYYKDFGGGDDPRIWINGILDEFGIAIPGGSVRVHLFPRLFGLGFCPLTTWFCHHADDTLAAILYEVHNTFGERHAYLVPVTEQSGRTYSHRAEKAFHVSPFIGARATYAFSVRTPGEQLALSIRETDRDTGQPILIATHVARRLPLTDGQLVKAALRYPLQPFKVIGGIHWEALQLFLKGVRFHSKPVPPTALVSFASQKDLA
jgi:hypothetical protein